MTGKHDKPHTTLLQHPQGALLQTSPSQYVALQHYSMALMPALPSPPGGEERPVRPGTRHSYQASSRYDDAAGAADV